MNKLLPLAVVWVCVFAQCLAGEKIYVAPAGSSSGRGTKEDPGNLATAIQRAATNINVGEIVLAGGEYQGNLNIDPKSISVPETSPLAIHAAAGEKPVLHNALRIEEAEAVPDMPGVFRTRQLPPDLANMWERDTRTRYKTLYCRDSVAAYPASAFADQDEKWLYFHTSDGKSAGEHKVYLGLSVENDRGLGIYRPHTRVEGLTFRDHIGPNSYGLVIHATNVTVRNCHFDNCHMGIGIGWNGGRYLVEDCTFVDVGQGIHSGAPDQVIRRCRFEKQRDDFLPKIFIDIAINNYSPTKGGVMVDNFIKGYNAGIRMKCPGGEPFIVRHNTIVDCDVGVFWVAPHPKCDTSFNIIVNARDFIWAYDFMPKFEMDYNLFWQPKELSKFAERNAIIRGANRGKFHVLADPRFIDPANGDYRLRPDSPALFLKDAEGRPAGAFEAVADDAAAKALPILELAFDADTLPCGITGELTFDRDPWQGGGTSKVRDLAGEANGPVKRLTGKPQFNVMMRAFDTAGKIVNTRITIGDQPAQETTFAYKQSVPLPDNDGEYPVRFEVRNDRGVWSKPAETIVRLDRAPPALEGEPAVLANDNGLVIVFKANEPGFAEVEFGLSDAYGHKTASPGLVKRCWEPGDAGEWVETWNVPRQEYAVAILRPLLNQGQTVHYRIILKDMMGLKAESKKYTAKIKGAVRELFVSPQGADIAGAGRKDAPWKTIQYAVERALPGDRIILLPGLYTDGACLTHGGIDDKSPLVLEAEKAGTVTIDGAAREKALFALEQVQYVSFRNLRMMGYGKTAVYAYKSPYVSIENCVFYNGPMLSKGTHCFFFYSPHGRVTRSLATGSEHGLYFLKSPFASVTFNTVSQTLFDGVGYDYSLEGSVQKNNVISFAGNSMFGGTYQNPAELKAFTSDYNNLGTSVIEHAKYKKQPDELLKRIEAQEFKVDYPPSKFSRPSKQIVSMYFGEKTEDYYVLKDWQDATGQDKHSIFADSKWVKPYGGIDSSDWHVKPDSPNIKAGENGATIGALGAP